MPVWILYSLLGTIIYVIVCFIDKYNLERQIKDYRGMAIYSAIVGFISGSILWVITGFPLLSVRDGVLVTLTGVLSIFSAAIYFYVMQQEQASKVIFLFQLIPVFVLILAVSFLHEPLTIKHLLGFFLILVPSLIVSQQGNKFSFKIDKNTSLLIIVDLLVAVSYVLFKFVVDAGSFSKVVAYESWGWAIGGGMMFTLLPSVRKAFITTTKNLKKSALVIIFGNETLYIASKLFIFLAVSLGSVYLVNVITGTQVLFGAILGVILTMAFPRIFKEDIKKSDLITKLVLGGVTLVGLVLIY